MIFSGSFSNTMLYTEDSLFAYWATFRINFYRDEYNIQKVEKIQ